MEKISLLFFILLLFSCTQKNIKPIYKKLHDNWEFKNADSSIWRTAKIPGSVHTDLLLHKIIPNPFIGSNEDKVQWIENQDYIYQTKFTLDNDILTQDKIELVFDGLDTYAAVFLNDSNILNADNMFRAYEIECKEILKKNNLLKIHFKSPIRIGKQIAEKYPYKFNGGYKVVTRKAGFHYGWDWGARLVTSGIWRPINIRAWSKARLKDINIRNKKISSNEAILNVSTEIEASRNSVADLTICCNDKTLITKQLNIKKGNNFKTFNIKIDNPKLWYTNGLGNPYLYTFRIELKHKGQVIDNKEVPFGIRTLNLIKKPDNYGESFYFELNGQSVFMKGVNYIPQDNFQNRVSKVRYDSLISAVKNAEINMIRVWGGGIYEDDYFYELCDKNGILVWQDFMFACAMYPGDKEFRANVSAEAEYNIKRLRNHPCIALWCGNNEIDEAWHNWGWASGYSKKDSAEIWQSYKKIFHELLPQKLAELDSGRAYHSSSPRYGRGNYKSQFYGDSHYWGVWHDAEPFENYEKKVPRFMSEFGFQSFPAKATIAQFAASEQHYTDSPEMQTHQKHPRGNKLIKEYMQRHYPIPENFDHFVYLSQLLQAEGITKGIEAHRRAKPYCGGTLYWQLNDCWPAVSWSSIDYYGRKKALYYFVKRSYAKYLLSFAAKADSLNLYLVSDDVKQQKAVLNYKIKSMKNKILKSDKVEFEIPANSSKVIKHFLVSELTKGCGKDTIYFTGALSVAGKLVETIHYYFVPIRKLSLPKAHFELSSEKAQNGIVITIKSDVYAKSVELAYPDAVYFSDNFFDLEANVPRKIFISTQAEKFNKSALKITCLNDILSSKRVYK